MATPFHLEVVTPERVLFSGDVDEVSMRTDGGEIAFLARHEDYVGAVDITVAKLSVLRDSGGAGDGEPVTMRIAVHGGFVHFDGEGMTILATVAELGTEVDVERARHALTLAEERFALEGPAVKPGAPTEGGAEESPTRLTGAMIALLAPESAEAAVARARVRLEAGGAATNS
ncbi:MAG TPA: F0F1 ATP synthase subunit epsilon [Acidimicrobiales bacterium]|nr:F0F1 ATP synthase subunit epsilon [Acidimicrobiales bacterium]